MRLKELHQKYRDDVEFIVVYVKEAHPTDKWWLGRSRTQRVLHRFSGNPARLDIADALDLDGDRATYEADRARDIRLNGEHGIDEVVQALELDALLFAGSSSAGIAAKPGYPTVIVPFGFVPNESGPAFPDGWAPLLQPYGVGFTGRACSEPRLLELAYAFEQATKRRVPPPGR